MTINDRIYGKVKIEEPILLELLKSPSVLKLKKISQYGVPDRYYHHKNYSRYEHSVGVMVLLRKLGATLEEQIAGLLHDVSVLAFSHVIDWVFGKGRNGVENYQDTIHKEFVRKTEIPRILEKFNFVLERILNERNFSLLENQIPNLCADRVDYALREFKDWLNPKIVDNCIRGLVNYNGEMVFSNPESAFDFATNFLELQTKHWGGYQAIIRYHLLSKALKTALAKKILSEKDFYKDESFILNKLEKSSDETIKEILKILRNKDLKSVTNNSGRRIVKKFRYVDPKVISNGKLIRLSKVIPKFQEIIGKHRALNKKGFIV